DGPRLHDRAPVIDVSLAHSHAHLERLRRHRLVREHAHPDAALAAQEVTRGHAAGLDLLPLDPREVQALEPEVAEADFVSALALALDRPALALPVLASLRHQRHVNASRSGPGPPGGLERRTAHADPRSARLGAVLADVDPALHADVAVRRLRLGEPV